MNKQCLHDSKVPPQCYENWQINFAFRLFLGLYTQNMEFGDKQAKKMIETGVSIWKSKNMKPYRPIFNFGSIMLKTNLWAHVSYGFP